MRKMEQIASVRAAEARRSLGVSASEPVDVIKLLREYRDISFVLRPFVSDISGMFVRADRAEVIAINTARSFGHQRFTAAHEYFHLLHEEGMLGAACRVGVADQPTLREAEADAFAANFLMPSEGIGARVMARTGGKRGLAVEDVVYLEQHFGVSHKAMVRRLRNLGYISADQFERMWSLPIRQTARTLGYDIVLYTPTHEDRIISSYAEKAKVALDSDLISFGKYEQLMLEAGLADLLFEPDVAEEDGSADP
ncbi:MAG: ImmA/IrrE family metallo-endopeptidase [Bacillota bacterium]|jgi:Zn-dependent peptidase ImmA (M78 family)